MKKYYVIAAALILGAATFTSCQKDEAPQPEFAQTTNSFTVVRTQELTLTPTINNLGLQTTYTWMDQDGKEISNQPSLTLKNLEVGTFKYTVYVVTDNGSISQTYTVIVNELIKTATFEGDSWTKLIDNPQYNGSLIYSGAEYKWTDSETGLRSECLKDDWSAWGYGFGWKNGLAISNYIDNSATATYTEQLSVPESNGSKNFVVVWDNESALEFADSSAYVIKSMMVSPTTYSLNNVKKACGDGYLFKVTATGLHSDSTTATLDIVLAQGTDVKTGWFKVDMSSLGAVKKVSFTFDGTDQSSYGLQTPKYFALDNIEVVK